MAIEPHKHCPICGTPIPLNELVCSPDCQKVWDARLNQQKRSRLILYVVIAIFLIILVFPFNFFTIHNYILYSIKKINVNLHVEKNALN